MKRSIAILALSLMVAAAWAELEYKGLDLGKDDSLLFSTQAELPGDGPYDTLFASDLNGGGTAQFTVFPEQITLVEGGARLQVQNRFGLFRSDRSLSGLAPVAGYPAFARGSAVRQGRLLPCATSPDGAYVLSVLPTSAGLRAGSFSSTSQRARRPGRLQGGLFDRVPSRPMVPGFPQFRIFEGRLDLLL